MVPRAHVWSSILLILRGKKTRVPHGISWLQDNPDAWRTIKDHKNQREVRVTIAGSPGRGLTLVETFKPIIKWRLRLADHRRSMLDRLKPFEQFLWRTF